MFYKLTLTTSDGFSEAQVEELVEYFICKCGHVYLTNEFGEFGMNSHLEGVVEFDTPKTSNVTNRVRGLYKKLGIEVSHNSIRVSKVTHLDGAIIYASKELEKMGKVAGLKGWKQTFIDKTLKDGVKSIPFKQLKKRGLWVTDRVAPAVIYEYCKAHNLTISYKADLMHVIRLMGDDGYMMSHLRLRAVYGNTMCLFGDGLAQSRIFSADTHFID